MAITLRTVTGSALSHTQLDTNFSSYFYSASVSASVLDLHYTGSAAIGLLPRSTSINLPNSSKWTDIAGGGISRNSQVQITGSTNISGSGNIVGTLTQGFPGLQASNFGHAEGYFTIASGAYSHAEGYQATTTGSYSHAEGRETITIGIGSHAEGYLAIASASYSHAEGQSTEASGLASHAEGIGTTALGQYSHAEGENTLALGEGSHAEGGNTQAIGKYSHAEGESTVALGTNQHVQGQYNISSSATSAFIIGNGTADNARRNLVFASGSQFQISGSLNVSGAINAIGDLTVQGNITAQQYIVSTSVYFVTESFFSGSHIFGNSPDDTHQFTGSVLVQGTSTTSGFSYASTFQPTTSVIFTGAGTDGLKMSGSTLNLFAANALTIGSGSHTQPNVVEYLRINSGGLQVNNGFDLTIHGNKQFNYGMFFHTASIAVANGSSGSVLLSTTSTATGVSIVSGSRITITNPGYYNIQFSAQLVQGSGAANFNLWFKKNGSNIANSNSVKTLATSTNQLMTVDIIDYASSPGDYYEIVHQSDNTNSSIGYIAASGNIPATPAVIVTVQQVR